MKRIVRKVVMPHVDATELGTPKAPTYVEPEPPEEDDVANEFAQNGSGSSLLQILSNVGAIELSLLDKQCYYSVVSGRADKDGVETVFRSGRSLILNWATSSLSRYSSPHVAIPTDFFPVVCPGDQLLLARKTGIRADKDNKLIVPKAKKRVKARKKVTRKVNTKKTQKVN